MRITKTKLRQIIKEELQREGFSWQKFKSDIGLGSKYKPKSSGGEDDAATASAAQGGGGIDVNALKNRISVAASYLAKMGPAAWPNPQRNSQLATLMRQAVGQEGKDFALILRDNMRGCDSSGCTREQLAAAAVGAIKTMADDMGDEAKVAALVDAFEKVARKMGG